MNEESNPTPEFPQRKDIRLKEFDYSRHGAYFITICTQNRAAILSDIVGEGSPLPRLTHYGEIADIWIQNISPKYPEISVNCYIIMSDHIHLILEIRKDRGRGNPSPTVDTVVGWLKYQITKEINQTRGMAGQKIFQRSFHDHIIRNHDDYMEIRKYIFQNPAQWQHDQTHTENP